MGPVTAMVISGVLVTWKGGVELGRERYGDDGKALTSELMLAGRTAKVTIARAPRHVIVEAGGQRVEREVPPDTLPLENGHWQAYALVAEWFAAASTPRPVKLLVPAQGATLDATVQVTTRSDGTRRVEVKAGALAIEAEVDKAGHVVRARVPLQQIEVRTEGERPAAPVGRGAPAGVVEETVTFESRGAKLAGVLWWPTAAAQKGAPAPDGARRPVVVFIAGSGPTDRDGNSAAGLRTDCYRLLAEALAARGIASLRYDKRGVGGSSPGVASEAELGLDHFVDDAVAAVARVRRDPRAGRVTLLGHSEGGLIALRAATRAGVAPSPSLSPSASPSPVMTVDALILLATAGRPLKDVLREQLASRIPAADLAAFDALLPELLAGRAPSSVPPSLAPIFRPSVLPFLRSELTLDPVALARAITVPLRIVQGTTDAQVAVRDAELLAAANAHAKLSLLPGVNHVLKEEPSIGLPQASYTDPGRPLGPGVVEAVAAGVAR